MNVGERIHMLRKENNMTLEDVATQIGVGRPTILKYESGAIANIPTERIHQLANLFKVSRPFLMGWTDERNVNPSENLDRVAKKLLETNEQALQNGGYWQTNTLSTLDCTTAATQAARALIKFDISRAPVYPHKVLQQSMLATMISFSDPKELDDIIRHTKLKAFRQANDLVMSTVYTTSEGNEHYIFAVNRDAPQGKNRLALAVELGHIYLGHTKHSNVSQMHDAECFAIHFEFPRALIQLLKDRGFVFTTESFQRIFGDCEWCLDTIQNAAPVSVSPELNKMVKELFVPHVNLLEETGILSMPGYGEELDLSRYMEGYEE